MGKKKKALSPEEARAERKRKAEKKLAARKRRTSAAAVMGALFSIIFVGTAGILLLKINTAVKERDSSLAAEEPYRPSVSAVTEVSSAAAESTTTTAATTAAPVTSPTETTTTVDPLVKIPDGNGETVTKKRLKNAAHSIYELDPLKSDIERTIGGYQGDWQIYFRHTASNKEFSIDSRPLYAASLIKLFAAGTVYQKVADGSFNADYADELVGPMISESDNYAFDQIINELGQSAITDWCRQQGYWDTVVTHETADEYNYENNRVANTDNTTSAQDVGRFLSNLYKGKVVNKEYSDKIIGYMKSQELRSKIPAGVPDGTQVANKTGETDDVDHDAAIVYCDTGDYVLVVMGDTNAFGWTADDYIIQISELVYKYFNGDPNAPAEEEEAVGESSSSSESENSEESTDEEIGME